MAKKAQPRAKAKSKAKVRKPKVRRKPKELESVKHLRFEAEERIRMGTEVCEIYAKGENTIESCCEAVGVNYETFKNWTGARIIDWETLSKEEQDRWLRRNFIHPLHVLYKNACAKRDTNMKLLLKNAALESLMKKVKGFDYEEVTTEIKTDANGTAQPVGVKKTTKHFPPSDVAVIFALKNVDPETFSDTQVIEHKGIEKAYERMSLAEMDEEEKKLRAEIAKKQNPS